MSVVRSMRGVEINMAALAAQHEDIIAVGNAKMNARGDIIGPGGRVEKPREQIAAEYYAKNPNAVAKQTPLRDIRGEVMSPADAVRNLEAGQQAKAQQKKRKLSDD